MVTRHLVNQYPYLKILKKNIIYPLIPKKASKVSLFYPISIYIAISFPSILINILYVYIYM